MTDPIPPTERILEEIRQIVATLPSEEEAERAIHIEQSVRRVLRRLTIPVVASALFLPFGVWQVVEARSVTEENRRGVRCILAELAEHRTNNRAGQSSIAARLGAPPPPPTALPIPPSAEEIAEICAPFITAHQPVAERR